MIIDDDEDDFLIIRDYINEIEGKDFIIDWCPDFDSGVEKIRAKKYDLYFVDYRLDFKTGLELLQQVNAASIDQPIVLLTGKGSKDIDVKAMEYGATDYLVKSDLTNEKIERCIRYALDRAAYLKQLRARENKYRNLFESSKDAVFITDENFCFMEVNQAAINLFGVQQKELTGKSLFDFIKKDEHRNKIGDRLRDGKKISNIEIEIESTNVVPCLLSVSFLEDPGDRRLLHCILHDISNMKKAEIANLQAQKLAANERLMRTLAHEIRNPLNNIGLSIDHLQFQLAGDEKQNRLLDILQRNTVRINHIITELLDLTKPQELRFEDLSLQEILDESIAMANDRISLQRINLQKAYPQDPVKISADKRKLSIAFSNILINAIEAMETNRGELSISLSDKPSGYSISIKDNGKGIPEEFMSKLFEPFSTLKQNGIGLGLATSFSIIQSHKGSVQVESKPNEGTNFIIHFNKNSEKKRAESIAFSLHH
jgi:PAS domain S-box-containing protein